MMRPPQRQVSVAVVLAVCVAGACSSSDGSPDGASDVTGTTRSDTPGVSSSAPAMPDRAEPASRSIEAEVSSASFDPPTCGTGFREFELPHVVEVRQPESQFDSNGSGVAIADLDGDDRLDIVLGNLDGPTRVFWNDGDLSFSESVLFSGRARAIQPLDIDADSDLDVVVAPGLGPPLVLLNEPIDGEPRRFRVSTLSGVTAPTYSMIWFDPDRDGDLDLVTAAYDMEFGRVVGGEYVSDGDHGVWFVEQVDGDWVSTQLSSLAHGLAATTIDLDGDGDHDIVIGNDYGVPDDIWLWDDGWTPASDLLEVTAANTMSFDAGDVDGDGDEDLYATDMLPFGDGNEEFWAAMEEMDHDPPGPQLVANVLIDLGDFGDRAAERGVDASGWSWSGRLADLDHDTDLDLYVANGMASSPLYFLDAELTEANVAFRNDGSGNFVAAPEWALDSRAGSRGIAYGDLDNDGDLDAAVSTVGSPARVFENQLCEGSSLIVETRARDGNTFALGATITVTAGDAEMTRTIRSGIGYLASDPSSAHFGIGDRRVESVEIRWPDGASTVIDDPASGRLTVTRPAGS